MTLVCFFLLIYWMFIYSNNKIFWEPWEFCENDHSTDGVDRLLVHTDLVFGSGRCVPAPPTVQRKPESPRNPINGGEALRENLAGKELKYKSTLAIALWNTPINIESFFRDVLYQTSAPSGICSESVVSFQLWMEALCGLRETCSLGSVGRLVLTLLSEDRGQKWFPDSCSSSAQTLDWSAGTCSAPEVRVFIKAFQSFGTILNWRHVISRMEMKLILACRRQPSSLY